MRLDFLKEWHMKEIQNDGTFALLCVKVWKFVKNDYIRSIFYKENTFYDSNRSSIKQACCGNSGR